MNYPLISEYIEAIKSPEDNFNELSYLRLVLGDDGLPVMSSGNFAVVFKMKDKQSGDLYALKCFTKEQEGRAEAYREIAKELGTVSSPYLISIRYLEKELFVDTDQTTEREFPVLLMDWVKGKTLDKYLHENLDNKSALEMLAFRFNKMAQWIVPQPFAHGDLKPDNILVREDGALVLVDYDGMYVPAMKGQKARELGSPDFRHPQRTENDFDEHIDDFPLVSILLSLKAISIEPQLLERHGAADRLILSERDYSDISHSSILKELYPSSDSELNVIIGIFSIICERKVLFDKKSHLQNLWGLITDSEDTQVTKEDLANAWIDEYGVKYSANKEKLLKAPTKENKSEFHLWKKSVLNGSYRILQGTKSICDNAFLDCRELTTIYLPNSVKKIGNGSFSGCSGLKTLKLNEGLLEIGNEVFKNCKSLYHILIPNSLIITGNNIFEGSRIQHIMTLKGNKKKVQSLLPLYKNIIEDLPY